MHAMTTDESGHLDGTANEKQPPPSTSKIPSIGDVLKLTAVASGVIYAGLFLGYRKYYNLLGVRPEEVGINNTFILVRSIGFILLAAVGTGLAILLTAWFKRVLKQRPKVAQFAGQRRVEITWSRHHAIHILAVTLLWLIVDASLMLADFPHAPLAALMGSS